MPAAHVLGRPASRRFSTSAQWVLEGADLLSSCEKEAPATSLLTFGPGGQFGAARTPPPSTNETLEYGELEWAGEGGNNGDTRNNDEARREA